VIPPSGLARILPVGGADAFTPTTTDALAMVRMMERWNGCFAVFLSNEEVFLGDRGEVDVNMRHELQSVLNGIARIDCVPLMRRELADR
jgi:hypothetical protein